MADPVEAREYRFGPCDLEISQPPHTGPAQVVPCVQIRRRTIGAHIVRVCAVLDGGDGDTADHLALTTVASWSWGLDGSAMITGWDNTGANGGDGRYVTWRALPRL